MAASREVKAAKDCGGHGLLFAARAKVQRAKEALGERGPFWWNDGSPDFNKKRVGNTPYGDWYLLLTAAS